MSLFDRISEAKQAKANRVPVDSGSVVVVDPAYLFTHEEWQEIVKAEDMHRAIFDKLKTKVGTEFVEGAYVSTGGDATFTAKRGPRGVPIVIECIERKS